MTEHGIQKNAVKELRKLNFICCVTSNGKRTANTKGTPDVFVYIGHRVWTGLEFKQRVGKPTKEQKELEEIGANYICRSVEDAVMYCNALKLVY
jgi:hypothetical protein